jgi:LCP family protein required for cell wall assembly
VVGIVGSYLWAQSIYNRVEKIPMGDTLASGSENYLIVGSDSREGLAGQRSDTMMLLRLDGDGASMLSIPRDLYVTMADSGRQRKLNAAFNDGPQNLVSTISQNLNVPIHHYLEVDFVSFAGLVDAIGGVTIDFPNPAFDRGSGLDVREAGPVELDGEQALAYVRSRHYTERVGGEPRLDPTADLGRMKRQQAFLRAVLGDLGDSKNPITMGRVGSRMADGLRVDDKMSLWGAMRFGWRMRGAEPESYELPTVGDSNASGAVLILRTAEAQPILDRFR